MGRVSFAANDDTILPPQSARQSFAEEEKKQESETDASSSAGASSGSRRWKRKVSRRKKRAQTPAPDQDGGALPARSASPASSQLSQATPPRPASSSSSPTKKKLFLFRKRRNSSSSSVGSSSHGGGGFWSSRSSRSNKEDGAQQPPPEDSETSSSPTSVMHAPVQAPPESPLQRQRSKSFRGGIGSSTSASTTANNNINMDLGADDSIRGCGSDDDPVVKLFEQRTTQRVRFTLEGGTDDIPSTPNRSIRGSPQRSPSKISRFLKGALFHHQGGISGNKDAEDADAEVQRELESVKHEMVWESTETAAGGEVVKTEPGQLTTTFAEDAKTRAQVMKLLNKARRAEYVHFRYEYAVKYYVKALDLLKAADYQKDHPVTVRTMESLNHAHHVQSSYNNSANIVKMGLKHEDAGELVRALKMFTIAYRIRVEVLGRNHPSLVVLLNMLGNIQIKRGELQEAMQVYELALKDDVQTKQQSDKEQGDPQLTDDDATLEHPLPNPPRNLLARSVTYRDMGTIYEKWGNHESALKMYHKSLDFLAEYKQLDLTNGGKPPPSTVEIQDDVSASSIGMAAPSDIGSMPTTATAKATGGDDGMEVLMGRQAEQEDARSKSRIIFQASTNYDIFFPPELDELMRQQKRIKDKNQHERGDYADIDAALTLHQIGQLHRSVGEYNLALSAFSVSLRGMKYCVGRNHPNVAAILGNLGNLQKEMGDMDSSFATYQQVLGIESYRLGLTHPDVAVTLHNIATIDAARGNHEHALALYRQVIALQRKLFGPNHVAVAVTSACMGDVYERVGDIAESVGCFEEAVRIKTIAMGRHSLEVARLLHKLGKLSIAQGEYHLADSYVSRAILVYRLNKLSEMDEWMMDAARDGADIDAAIAMGFVDRGYASSTAGGYSSSYDGDSRSCDKSG